MADTNATDLPRCVKDMRGHKIGRLTPLEYVGNSLWKCLCDCGQFTTVNQRHLNAKRPVRSCGCAVRRLRGMHGTPEYTAWVHMVRRCTYKDDQRWQDYGARGISVCQRWLDSFLDFFADMGPRPSPQHSLDRIDNSGNYKPGNCRWATPEQQNRNTRRNRMYSINGETKCLTDWAKQFGVSRDGVDYRLRKGWSFERALTEAVERTRNSKGQYEAK